MRGSRTLRTRMPIRSLRAGLAAAAVAALCLAPAGASAQEAERSGVAQYFVDRGHDFLDIFRLRAGVPRHGEGYGAKARVTSLAQAGFVHYDGLYAGMERRGIGWTDERRTEGGISIAYASANEMLPRGGNQFLRGDTLWSDIENRRIVRNLPHWDDGRGHFLSAGAEVATPILALDAGVYPSEALDFLTGFFTIDIFNDDELWMTESYVHTAPTTKPGPDLKAATARKRAEMEALYGPPESADSAAAPSAAKPETPAEEEAPLTVEHSLPERTGDKPLSKEEIDLLNKSGSQVLYPPAEQQIEKAPESEPVTESEPEEAKPAGPEPPPPPPPANEQKPVEPEEEEPEEE